MVVGAQAGRAGNARLEHRGARPQRAVQPGGLGAKENQGAHRRQAGKVAGAAVVGDQQVGVVKQHQQFADAAGVAGQVQAQRAVGLRLQRARQSGVFAQPDQAHCMAGLAQPAGHPRIVGGRPGALGQQPATGIQQHQAALAQHGKVGLQLAPVAGQLGRAEHHTQGGVGWQVAQRCRLVAWRAVRLQRIGQRQKLLADVLIGVVGNGAVDEVAAVQPLLRVRCEAGTHRRAAEVRQQAADAREQLAINHRVKRQRAQGPADSPDVTHQSQARTVVKRMQVLKPRQAQQGGNLLVFFELQHMQADPRVALAQGRKQRAGKHHTAHF